MKITVLGGTGYTGTNVVREAASRGHDVTSFSRTLPPVTVDGVHYTTGSLTDAAVRERAVAGADVVFAALSPRAGLEDSIGEVYRAIEELAAASGVRYGVVGGFSCLRPTEGAPRIAESGDVPEAYAAEANALFEVLVDLEGNAPEGLDWFFVSPAQNYGSYAPGTATGAYRTGGPVAFYDADGVSAISGADFALAVVDEIEKPSVHRAQVSFAY